MENQNTTSLRQGSIATATLSLNGMHCPACAARVEQALKAMPGVQEAAVDLASQQAQITYDLHQVNPEKLAAAITGAGYIFKGLARIKYIS